MQILDAPVPQMVDQLVVAFWHLDFLIPEQVVEVPKISSSPRRSRRRWVPSVRTAEQLPTIVSYSSLHGLVEQNVYLPVPHCRHGRGGGRGLQGLHPEQNSAAEHVDIPVLHGRARGGGLRGHTLAQGPHRNNHNHNHNHNNNILRRCAFLLCYRSVEPSGRHVAAWRTRRCVAAQTVTPALMVET